VPASALVAAIETTKKLQRLPGKKDEGSPSMPKKDVESSRSENLIGLVGDNHRKRCVPDVARSVAQVKQAAPRSAVR